MKDRRYATHWKKVCRSFAPAAVRQKVVNVLARPVWKQAKYVKDVQAAIARAVGVDLSWVLPTSSCTSALAAAQEFVGIATSAPLMTYAASFAWQQAQGAEVALWDVDEDGWARESWDQYPWPVGPELDVDLWGRPRPNTTNLPSILDAAHRFAGPEHKELAERGVAICYSFGPMKEVAAPCGGALVWRGLEERREDVEAFIMYGQKGRYPTGRGGINGYMNEPTAAMIVQQLRRHARLKERRRGLLEAYQNFLGDYLVTKPGEASGHLAVIRLDSTGWTNRVKFRFQRMGLEYGVHYPVAEEHADTHAYDLSKRIITLPCHELMQPCHAARISRIVLAG